MADRDTVPMPAGIDVDDEELLAELLKRQATAPEDGRVSLPSTPWKWREAQKQ